MQPHLLAAEVDQDDFVHAVVIVRIVGRVVEVALDLAGVRIEDQRAVGEQVVTKAHVTVEVRTGVADGPVQGVGVLVVGTRDPGRTATVLPAFAGPGVVAWLARAGNRVGLPHRGTGVGIDRRDPAANAVLGAGSTEDDLARQCHRHDGEGFGVGVVTQLLVPDHLTGLVVERNDMRVERGQIDLVLVYGNATVHYVAAQLREHIARQLALVLPVDLASGAVDREHLVVRAGHVDRAVDHDSLAVLAVQNAEGHTEFRLQALDVALVDLRQRAVARGRVITTVQQPVAGVLVSVEQHVVGDVVGIQLRSRLIQTLCPRAAGSDGEGGDDCCALKMQLHH